MRPRVLFGHAVAPIWVVPSTDLARSYFSRATLQAGKPSLYGARLGSSYIPISARCGCSDLGQIESRILVARVRGIDRMRTGSGSSPLTSSRHVFPSQTSTAYRAIRVFL